MNFTTESAPRKRAGVGRAKRLSLRIDMTPMVDLGFLLVAFFVMTTQLSEPQVLRLTMPKEGPNTPVPQSGTLTVVLDGSGQYAVYEGALDEPTAAASLRLAGSLGKAGVRDLIQDFQRRLDQSTLKDGRNSMVLIIKPTSRARFEQVVDALDEATINNVKKYVIDTQLPEEEAALLALKRERGFF